MKCVVAMMQHETNTFSPLPTPLAAFANGTGFDIPPMGDNAIRIYGSADFAFAAMIDVATQHNYNVQVPIAAYAEPSGKVDDQAFEFIYLQIAKAVRSDCDALFLDLHGAMVTESYDDGEGELLRRIRSIRPDLPIAVALDFHTNLTSAMVENCTVMDGYRTYPHVDMYETGKRAAESLFSVMAQGIETKLAWKALPMMTHMINQTPSRQPMKDIMDLAIEAEENTPLLNTCVFGGFPLADIAHVSFSAVAIEFKDNFLGEGLVKQICDLAWQRRQDFVFQPEPLQETISNVKQLTKFPVVIADHGDNCGAGGSADDLTVLGEMLQQGMTDIIVGPIWDPIAVEQIIQQGEGSEVEVAIGGKTSVKLINQKGVELLCRGKVERITDGRFTITAPMQTGLEVCLGRSAVVKTENYSILVSENRWEPYDPGCFTHAGLDPSSCKYVLLKSRQHFRAGFEQIAGSIVLAAGPGVCSSDYNQFDFQNLKRPIFPLDTSMPIT